MSRSVPLFFQMYFQVLYGYTYTLIKITISVHLMYYIALFLSLSSFYLFLVLNEEVSSFYLMMMQLGERTATILKHVFPVPKPDCKRVMSFVNQSDNIVFR